MGDPKVESLETAAGTPETVIMVVAAGAVAVGIAEIVATEQINMRQGGIHTFETILKSLGLRLQ
jgi:hypothetical protein